MLSDRLGEQVVSDKPADPTMTAMRDRLRASVVGDATKPSREQKPG
jgi:hypothetical protein